MSVSMNGGHPSSSSRAGMGDNIVDLEEIVKHWARDVFDITKSNQQAKIPKEMLQWNINWRHVKFHFEEPKYDFVPHTMGESAIHKPKFQPQVNML